jgi:hypothetical protein
VERKHYRHTSGDIHETEKVMSAQTRLTRRSIRLASKLPLIHNGSCPQSKTRRTQIIEALCKGALPRLSAVV